VLAPFVRSQTVSSIDSSFNPDSALQQIVEHLQGTPLTLAEAIASALQHAAEVKSAEAALLAAQGTSRREAGGFDPTVFFTLEHLDQHVPTASFFAGAPALSTKQTIANGGVSMRLPVGTRLELSLNSVRLETNSAFAFLNPQYNAFGMLSIREPLLGGFHVSARKQAEKADRELEAAKARYDQEVLAVRAAVEEMYWDVYAAEHDFAVQKLTRDRAEAFLLETEMRARTGLIGPNQVATAKTFLAEQEIAILDREEQLDRLSDQLAVLMGVQPPSQESRFLAKDTPPDQSAAVEVEGLVEQALQAAAADVAARRALSRAAFWEALPHVDVVGTIGGSGLAGSDRDVVFGSDTLRTTRGGVLSDALRQALKREFSNWSIGLEVTIPIGLRSGLGEQDRLEAEVMLAEQRALQQERELREAIRSGYREVMNGRKRLIAARNGVQAAQEQDASGHRRQQGDRLRCCGDDDCLGCRVRSTGVSHGYGGEIVQRVRHLARCRRSHLRLRCADADADALFEDSTTVPPRQR